MWFYKILIPFSLCFFLTACGFHPLYAPHECSDVSYPLKIATISDRHGQILRNYLVDLLTPEGSPPHPKYVLQIKLTESVRNTGIKRTEATFRKEAILTANIVLRNSRTNKIAYTHSTKAINSFSVLTQNYYADLIAEDYAKKEALRLLAEKIALLLTTYLDTPNEN